MLNRITQLHRHFLHKRTHRFASSDLDDISISYAELVEKLTGLEIPKKYNSKFTDIIKHVEPAVKAEKPAQKSLSIKSKDFMLDNSAYSQYLANNTIGTYEIFNHKDVQVKVMGFNYTNIKLATLWKTMLLSKCDAVCIAVRPDLFLKEFKLNVRNPKTHNFSNRLYYQQLEMDPSTVMCNVETENKVAKYIDGVFMSNEPAKIQSFDLSKTQAIYHSTDKITNEVLSLALLFAKRKGLPVIAGDMPEVIYREQITNPLTVSQLKQILAESSIESALNPDIRPETPLSMYMGRAPEFILQPSDAYTASLIEYIAQTKKYKRVLIVGGLGQAYGIKQILQNRTPVPLDEVMAVPDLVKNLYGKTLLEEYIEKQSIFDVLSMGKMILKKNDLLFRNSKALIEKYSGLSEGDRKLVYYKDMHEDFVLHHFKLFTKQYNIGLERKKDYFVSKVIERDNN